MKLSIVVPCYNEAKNIPLILSRFSEVVKRDDVEIIIVNNNSKDDTGAILSAELLKYSFAKSIFEPVPGYGSAVLAGLKIAKGEFIGWTHGDMQTPPSDIIRALEIIERSDEKNVYIKGNRKGRPFFDSFFTFGMSVFESIYFCGFYYDINAQPNIFHRSFFEKWINPPLDFSFDLYSFYMAKKLNMKIIRFPVIFPKRIYGESSWNKDWQSKWRFIKRTITFSLGLKRIILK